MRDLASLADPGAIRAHVGGLWRADAFREAAARPGSIVGWVVDRFASAPRAFATMTEPGIEASHFTSWFGVILRRDTYANPVLHDLYYLHEMAHAATLTYDPHGGWEAWQARVVANEFEVSMLTEILVYLDMPGLRAASFAEPIWADRFLGDGHRAEWEGSGRPRLVAEIRASRARAMLSPGPGDRLDALLAGYAAQNAEFARVWERRHAEVEGHMAGLAEAARTRGWDAAASGHAAWLEAKAERGVPFRAEAEAFAAVYKANKARHAAA